MSGAEPMAWRVQWKEVDDYHEMLAWFQATRRSGSAPGHGQEVVAADDYDTLAAALSEAVGRVAEAEKALADAERMVALVVNASGGEVLILPKTMREAALEISREEGLDGRITLTTRAALSDSPEAVQAGGDQGKTSAGGGAVQTGEGG